jgi:hypothetical protein
VAPPLLLVLVFTVQEVTATHQVEDKSQRVAGAVFRAVTVVMVGAVVQVMVLLVVVVRVPPGKPSPRLKF